MRRKDREMPGELALAVVDNCAWAVMATVNADGTPYCVPLSPVRDGEWLYFHCAKEGQKIDNLRGKNSVCVSSVGNVKPSPGEFSLFYESAIINGTAFEVRDPEEKIRALHLISLRYTKDNMPAFDGAVKKDLDVTAVWKIRIDGISGKSKRPK